MRVPDVYRRQSAEAGQLKTCPCVDRSDVGVKPSGLVYCVDCGLILPLQPPKPRERP